MAPRMQSRALHMGFTTSTSPGILCCEQRVAGARCCPKLGRFLHPGATHVCIRLACANGTRSAPPSAERAFRDQSKDRPPRAEYVAHDPPFASPQAGFSRLRRQRCCECGIVGRALRPDQSRAECGILALRRAAHDASPGVTGHGVSLRRARERDIKHTFTRRPSNSTGRRAAGVHSVQSPAAHPASLGALPCRCRFASHRRRSDRKPGAQLGQRVACPTATQNEWAGAAAAAAGVLQLADPRGRARTRQSAARRPMHTAPRGHGVRSSPRQSTNTAIGGQTAHAHRTTRSWREIVARHHTSYERGIAEDIAGACG
jgi:hypothetical protein